MAGAKKSAPAAASGKKAKISSETKPEIAVKLTKRTCECGCGAAIPSNNIFSVERTTFALVNGRQKSNTRMYFFIKGHENKG